MNTSDDDLRQLVARALAEDVGEGDWTTQWTVAYDRIVHARVVAKAAGVIAGISEARATFLQVDPGLNVVANAIEGDEVSPGTEVMLLHGRAHSILTAERVALNFLQHLSGIASATRRYVDAVAGTAARILDTRKTTPGLRALEKRAVLAGGGVNHRCGLYDMILVKENHIRAAGGITAAIRAVLLQNSSRLRVEVETTDLDEVREALEAGVDRILLDNMPLSMLREAVALVRSAAPTTEIEASGGVSLETVRSIAEMGVDFVSVGAITHSVTALDLSLLIDRDD